MGEDREYDEAMPRDFSARLPRRVHGIGRRSARRHAGRRALALLVAVAVPAFAAPGEWSTLAVQDAGRAEVVVEPMPFERKGDSFPGSAFYYLAPDAPAKLADAGTWDDGRSDDGPAARSLRIAGSFTDRNRALACLTQAIYYEAASEPDDGQRAVAQVVLNRVAHPAFPKTVCGVVYQGSERGTGCQFTFTCDGSLARAPQPLFWRRAESVARAALAGYVYTPIGLSTHYHTIAVHPAWDRAMNLVRTIGAHQFFTLTGLAGAPQTFRAAYAGGEPVAAPAVRAAGAPGPDPSLDPVAIERAYASGLKSAQESAPAAEPRGPTNLPEAYGIKPEYRDSGRWIAQPGT